MMKIAALVLVLVLTSAGSPSVTTNTPTSGSTVGSPKLIVTVTFDQPMDPDSVTKKTFTLMDHNGLVPGQVFYIKPELKAVFLPDAELKNNATFIAEIDGVQSIEGVPMGHHFSWRFTTASLPNLVLPQLGIVNISASSTMGPNFPPGYWGWVPETPPVPPTIHKQKALTLQHSR